MQDFIGHTSPGQDVAASTINLAWVGRILKDRWRLIACSSLVTLLIAIAYLMTATPQYVSTLWLGLDDQKPKVLSSQEMLQSLRFDLGVPMLQQVVEGQITMIRSASIAEKTLKAIDPNFPRNSPIDDRTLAAFGKKLSVERLGSTFIIQVSYSDPDPQRAAKVANTIAAQYIDAQLRERNQAKLSATQWLEKRVEEFKERVRIEGNRIEKFKNEHNLVTVGTELMSERELSRTLDRLIESRADAANALARLKNAEQIVKDPARLDAVFSSSQSPVIGELKRQQLTLSNQLTMTITRMGEDHPDVRVLKAQLNEVTKSISRELERVVENLRNEATISRVKAELQAKDLEALQERMIEGSKEIVALKELELDNRTTRDLFIALSTRLKESHVQSSLDTPDTRIVQQARPAQFPSWPRKPVVALAGLMSGLIFASSLILLQEFLFGFVRSPDEASSITSFATVASLPATGARSGTGNPITRAYEQLMPSYRSRDHVMPVERTVLADLSGRYAQGIFSLVSHLEMPATKTVPGQRGCVITVVSPTTGDGKTTTALNLVDYMAAAGKRVLLIDADCRSPALTASLMPEPTRSIADLVIDPPDASGLISKLDDADFDFCPGPHGQVCNRPTIVVASQALAKLIAEARDSYDYVVIDTPALNEYVDGLALVTQSDIAIVVARYGKTTRSSLKAVSEKLLANQARDVAIVLNETPTEQI